MVVAASIVLVSFFVLGVVVRALVQRRVSGTFGIRGVNRGSSTGEKAAGILLAATVVLFVVGLVLGERAVPSVPAWLRWSGLFLAIAGAACTLVAEWAMGASWRIGVDTHERTDLVVAGPFRYVRNPIFTSMCATGIGIAMAVPDLVTIAAAVCLVAAIEVQVRLVEEPYLLRAQGDAYASYCARTGRFVPGLGKHVGAALGA